MSTETSASHPEASVLERYSAGAQAREEALCCPVSFDPRYLEVLPEEIVARDYGCGDPTPYVREGDTVLDLGSGAGKVCWIAAQVVGSTGNVIGIDMNTDMLALAREHHDAIASKVGFDNVRYHRAMIQDLRLDLEALEQSLRETPIAGIDAWLALRQQEDALRRGKPLIADASVDVVLSNCVLNLVRPEDKHQLFREIFRVVKPGGRVAISDIVADTDVPHQLQDDPELWSGCISGAYREDLFLEAFATAGFHGVELVKRDATPWRTVGDIEFRAVTVRAFKDESPGCGASKDETVIYHGPFVRVHADDGQVFERGKRTPVRSAIHERLQREPYRGMFSAATGDSGDAADGGSGGCC